jgi:hypothetical protein
VRSLIGDLAVARAAGVGLVPEHRDPQLMLGRVNREFAAAGFNDWVREADLRALGLAHVRGGWLVHSLGGRLLFPLRGAAHGAGVVAMALDGGKPRWRCHTAALGTALPSTLVFEAGLLEPDMGVPITVAGDPASALQYRAGGSQIPAGWGPVGPVVAPPTRRLTADQAAYIARYAKGDRVAVFVDEDNPKRAAQFTTVLEDAGLQVSNALDERERTVEALEASARDLRARPTRSSRRASHEATWGRAMSREGGGPR